MIIQNKGVINPIDLTITYPNDPANIQVRSSAGDHSVTWFWWGSRQYFWSNAAVEDVAYKYDHYGQFLGAAGIVGTAISAGIASTIGY